jgi:hypothetical protein
MIGAKSIKLLAVLLLLVLQGIFYLAHASLSLLLRLLRLFSLFPGLLRHLSCLPRRSLQGCQGTVGFLSLPESLRGGLRRPFSNVPGLRKITGLACAMEAQGLKKGAVSSIWQSNQSQKKRIERKQRLTRAAGRNSSCSSSCTPLISPMKFANATRARSGSAFARLRMLPQTTSSVTDCTSSPEPPAPGRQRTPSQMERRAPMPWG